MAKAQSETKLAWVPTADMSAVLDQLAMGYSLNAASRVTGVALQTIWSWINELAFSAQFREEIQARAKLFQENLAIGPTHEQLAAYVTASNLAAPKEEQG